MCNTVDSRYKLDIARSNLQGRLKNVRVIEGKSSKKITWRKNKFTLSYKLAGVELSRVRVIGGCHSVCTNKAGAGTQWVKSATEATDKDKDYL